MTSNTVLHHQFENGFTLVAQPMPWLASAAFAMSLPAGCRYDAADRVGTASFASEMVQRGCGDLDSRQFIEQLQLLGVDYSSSVSNYHSWFGGAMKATELHDTLSIYRDVVRTPHLPESQFEDGRMVCLQEIMAMEDDLSRKTLREVRLRHYGDPNGRGPDGTVDSISAMTYQQVADFVKNVYQPKGCILAVAGKIDFEALRDHVAELFADWTAGETPQAAESVPTRGVYHMPFDSEQTHIALACPGVAYTHEDFYTHRAAIGVLSDGLSSRLFHEVREKRGLCYTVFASCNSVGKEGSVIAYSGTSSARAQETLDVLVAELQRLREGILPEELARLKVQFRSNLVMQQESCRSRAGSIASDWYHLGRVRDIDEINGIISGLTVEAINEFLVDHYPRNFDLVTLGPSPLELKEDAVSSAQA